MQTNKKNILHHLLYINQSSTKDHLTGTRLYFSSKLPKEYLGFHCNSNNNNNYIVKNNKNTAAPLKVAS